jgi:N-acetylglucosamine-6-sulfatase
MKKHRFYIAILGLFLVACQGACPAQEADAASARPNFVIFMTDDQPAFTLDYLPIVQERLVDEGVLFENAFATTPLCCPSRASILTGLYAHNHGVLTNREPLGGVTVFDDSSTIATWLKQAGYRTSFVGKYLNGYGDIGPVGYIPPGWDDWHVFLEGSTVDRFYFNYSLAENGETFIYGDEEADFSNDVLTEKMLDFIQAESDDPFFAVIAYFSPHQPFGYPDRHADMFRTDEQFSARRPPNFYEEDVSDKPEWLQGLERVDFNWTDRVSQRSLRSLQSVDESVGRVLDALDCAGKLDNTFVLFLSDNGATAGEHGLANAKNCPYEECIKLPFVVRYPPLVEQARVESNLVLNVDIAPTIAQLADIEPAHEVNGISIAELLSDASVAWRDSVLIEHWPGEEGLSSEIPYFESIRTAEWKYVRYETGEEELYNLATDPFELENLVGDPKYAETISRLAIELDGLLRD